MQKVKEYFKDYPTSQKVFQTADGYLFHQQGDANLHAGSLKDKRVTEHARPVEDAAGAEETAGNKTEEALKPEGKKATGSSKKVSGKAKAEDKPAETQEGGATEETTEGANPEAGKQQ